MTFPIWMLLGFAMWTITILLFTVGIYRWSRILTSRVEIKNFRADDVQGDEWYLRAMRAHANCVENLPIFAVIVFAVYVSGLSGFTVDILAAIVLISRMFQSLVHVAFVQTNFMASIRFAFFFAQVVCFISLAVLIAQHAV